MAEVGTRRLSAGFFCVDPLRLIEKGHGRGTRTDLRRALTEVSSYKELVLTNPDCAARCRNVALDYFRFTRAKEHRVSAPEVVWIYGATGTGKTRLAVGYAMAKAGDDFFVHPPGHLKWWDGYEDQPVVIIDDFRRAHVRESGGFAYLLRILDRYDVDIEVKGGFKRARWNCVIITAPRDPVSEFTYRGSDGGECVEEDIGQLVRRLTRIIEIRVLGGVVQEVDHTDRLRARHTPGPIVPLGRSELLGVDLQRPE